MHELRDWLAVTQKTMEDWQHRIDVRVRHVVGGIHPFTGLQGEVAKLADRIDELEKKLQEVARTEPGDDAAGTHPGSPVPPPEDSQRKP